MHVVPDQVGNGSGAARVSNAYGSPFTPLMVPLFRDLAQILNKAAQPVAGALRRYADVNSRLLDVVSRELPFYLGAARLFTWLRDQGLPVCRPELAPEEERSAR